MKRRQETQEDNTKKPSRSQFEDLSNELLHEIFDYGDFCLMYDIFLNLNSRFRSLLTQRSFLLNINFPLKSKSVYERQCKEIIQPNTTQISWLKITKQFLEFFTIDRFSSLKTLITQHIPPDRIITLLQQLRSLPNFSSLSIESSDYFQDLNVIYLSLFQLTKLKYCHFKYPHGGNRVPLALAVDPRQILEHLIIDGHCRLDQLVAILSYLPRLKHLSCNQLYGAHYDEMKTSINLTTIRFKLHALEFHDLKLFLVNVSSRLKILRIWKTGDDDYLRAKGWEELIEHYMPCLDTFDFQYSNSANFDTQQKLVQEFSSKFWIDRNWFFDYYYYYDSQVDDECYFNFFSIIPYRYEQFKLHENFKTHHRINYARHVEIEGCSEAEKCTVQFPCVKELTLHDVKDVSWHACSIKSIIPLLQISKLYIKDENLPIKKLISLLQDFPNVESLKLFSLPKMSVKQSSVFSLVPVNNRITRVKVYEECDMKDLKLINHMCPRVEHLRICIDESHLGTILEFLLLNAKHLFLLVLSHVNYDVVERVQAIIVKKKLIENYSVERNHGKLYLWR
ncbi:unnamed protein product [Adineta ricciae]|uniref:F-box domain-containing protein n=1 Tax=Adineta ricciae TaxID=249248 RepID=A0A815JR41_ADIRI|nr:unnamed protein product [Adineta ricciae]CAF1385684.1 unnamed protein product [Adineta ricciae]